MPLIDLVDQRRQQAAHLHRPFAATRALLGDREHPLLGLIDQLARLASVAGEGGSRDFASRVDQPAQERALADDLRVGAHIGRRGRIARQRAEVPQSAGGLEPAAAFELLGHGDHVSRPAGGNQLGQGRVDELVIRPVEILGNDQVPDLVPGQGVDEQSADDGLFGFDRMRGRRASGVGDFTLPA